MLNGILSFFFPNPCIVCGKPAGRKKYVCNRCKDKPIYIGRNSVCKTCLDPIPPHLSYCPKCLVSKPPYNELFACVKYKGEVKGSVLRCKFFHRPDFCESFALIMHETLSKQSTRSFDAVVCVPMTRLQVLKRGFNQSEVIARKLSQLLGVDFIPGGLAKIKETRRQSSLRMNEREANVRGVFMVADKNRVSDKNILLVDDIFTTGATVREASRVLSCVCKSVTVCTFAKTFPER